MKRNLVLALVLPLIFTSCATAHKMNNVSLGMTKQEVIGVLGQPESIGAKGNIEFFNYRLTEKTVSISTKSVPYFVRLVNGKVDAYGRWGDFDSTKDPKQKIDLSIEDKK